MVRADADGPARDAAGGVPVAVARCVLRTGRWFAHQAVPNDVRSQQAEDRHEANLVRHIFGNPFRPYPAPPSWSAAVVNLAQAVYNGADAGFALHDALLESGHPDLAAHFMEQGWHPKGCWAVDLIMGRQ